MAYIKAQNTYTQRRFELQRFCQQKNGFFNAFQKKTLLIFEQRNVQLAGISKLQII